MQNNDVKEEKFSRSIYFEKGAEDEIWQMLLGIENITLSKHFINRYMQRMRKVKLPSKSALLSGKIVEYTKINGKIDKVLIKCNNVRRNYNVFYSVTIRGELLTVFYSKKGSQFIPDKSRYVPPNSKGVNYGKET